jgi:hypothetical protein
LHWHVLLLPNPLLNHSEDAADRCHKGDAQEEPIHGHLPNNSAHTACLSITADKFPSIHRTHRCSFHAVALTRLQFPVKN